MNDQIEPVSTDWLETLSGRRFNPFDPEPDFELRDLVWGCARTPRYNGQFKEEVEHYCVGEHLVLMTRWLLSQNPADFGLTPVELRQMARTAAGHDLQEGLVGDMVRPLKRNDPYYRAAEDKLSAVLARRYGFQFPLPPLVKWLDNRILVDERAQVMNPSGNDWGSIDGLEPLGITLQFWSPRRAASELFGLLEELEVRD